MIEPTTEVEHLMSYKTISEPKSKEIPEIYHVKRSGKRFVNGWNPMNRLFALSRTPIMISSRFKKITSYRPGEPPSCDEFSGDKVKSFFERAISCLWIGHATVYFQMNGTTFITDPVLGSVGDGPFAIRRRAGKPIKRFSSLPKVDYVLLSHDHMDHLDKSAVQEIACKFNSTFICGSGVDDLLKKWGINPDRIVPLQWWETSSHDTVSIKFVPAQHWGQRGINDRNSRLWGGFVVESTDPRPSPKRVYYTGDTGYDRGLFETIAGLGPMDLSLIPIGCGQPEKMMKYQHINSAAAAQIHTMVQSRMSLAIHHGTFFSMASLETLRSPGDDLTRIVREGGIDNFVVGNIGTVVAVGENGKQST